MRPILRTAAYGAAAAAVLAGSAAHAIDFTFAEAGLAWKDLDADLAFSGGSLAAEDGYGGRLAAGLDLAPALSGFYLDGEIVWTTPELRASVGSLAGSADATDMTVRLSGGYKIELSDLVAIYGQAGYAHRSLDVDDLTLADATHTFTLADAEDSDGGYEIEVGIRAEVLPRLELTGALIYSDIAALAFEGPEVTIPEQTTVSGFAFEDGGAVELGATIDLFGATALRASILAGEASAASIGLRMQF